MFPTSGLSKLMRNQCFSPALRRTYSLVLRSRGVVTLFSAPLFIFNTQGFTNA